MVSQITKANLKIRKQRGKDRCAYVLSAARHEIKNGLRKTEETVTGLLAQRESSQTARCAVIAKSPSTSKCTENNQTLDANPHGRKRFGHVTAANLKIRKQRGKDRCAYVLSAARHEIKNGLRKTEETVTGLLAQRESSQTARCAVIAKSPSTSKCTENNQTLDANPHGRKRFGHVTATVRGGSFVKSSEMLSDDKFQSERGCTENCDVEVHRLDALGNGLNGVFGSNLNCGANNSISGSTGVSGRSSVLIGGSTGCVATRHNTSVPAPLLKALAHLGRRSRSYDGARCSVLHRRDCTHSLSYVESPYAL
ncbi:hypothetical protein ANPL_02705 [Anaplasma platys]|uniref:Uncharacterized protein n=1 Tax=Anaplasma platys TaxID=949 RepID=A0A858PYB3_9RICK|nr:hypothetical protein [Anaplasma platys]QJC27603.1 hypothetical protein ANPL_02705 [Anaplasma platys]